MAWYLVVWQWLAHAAVGSLLILAVGGLAVRLCRQPVQRLRVIELALVGCLIAPWLSLLPDLPHWSAGVLSTPGTAEESPAAPLPSPEPIATTAAAPALPPDPPTEVAADAKPVDVGAGLAGSDGELPATMPAAPPVVPQRASLLPPLPTPFVIVLV